MQTSHRGYEMNTLNQTLQEKFPHLELSVLKLSEVKRDNESFRIDDKFFMKHYINLEQYISNFNYVTLKEMSYKITDGTHYTPTYENDGVIFLSSLNVAENYLNFEAGYKYISCKEHKKISTRCLPQEYDILLRKVGGEKIDACVVPKLNFEFSIFVSVALIRIKTEEMNPYFLSTFINSHYGRQQLIRYAKGIAQLDLHLEDLAKLKIPLLPMPFQLEIEKLVKDSHLALEQSKALYKEAEDLLYTELGLNPQNPLQSILQSHSNDINFRIATLKESFLKTGRLDSEYYQVKYEKFEALIKSYKNGWDCVKTFFSQNDTSCNFSKSEYKYIEIGDINTSSGIASYNTIQTNELPANAKMAVAKDDILISKVRPYRGAVAIIDFKAQDIVASGAFAVLREKGNFKKEVLQVLLRTSIYKEWLLKWNVGTSYPVIKDEDILNLPIPKIDLQTQASIASHIQQSLTLRAEAKALLNEAKAKVESAISGGGGGVNNASFVAFRIQIFRIYFPQIKAKLRDSKRYYRLGEWELLENLLGLKTLSFSKKSFDKNVESFKFSKNSHTQKLNISIQSLSRSFGVSGRLDSEYYQVKYERNEAVIKSKPYARLKDIVAIKKSIEPGSKAYRESGIPFIRVSNLSPFGISQSEVFLDSKDFKKGELESFYPKANTILLSKDGSVGISYCLENDLECVTSGAILHLTIKNQALILPQYLSLVLNALPTKLQAQRDSGGSIIAHWKISEIENLLIPLLGLSIQETIESKITQSFALRAKSKELLEKAKAKVEVKISLLSPT